jgi:hypothetical protein
VRDPHRVGDPHSQVITPSVPPTPTLSETHRVAILRQHHRIYPARTAQDGHSLGEQAVYYALWSAGDPETAESRLVSIGYERLAEAARLHWTNVKKNLRTLEAKLAIEAIAPENSGQRIGKTYRVYSYRAILERRRNAGLVWYRRTKGVQLLTSEQADAHSLSILHTLGEPLSARPSHPLRDPRTVSLGESHRPSLSDSHTPLETIRKPEETASSELSVQLVEAVREAAGLADDDGIRTLVRLCRQRAPDAADYEIAHFVRLKARQALRTGNVANLTGFLHAAVPRCFEGEAFRQFRRAEQQRRELERQQKAAFEAENARFRAEQQAVLANPLSTPEQRRLARVLLGLDES